MITYSGTAQVLGTVSGRHTSARSDWQTLIKVGVGSSLLISQATSAGAATMLATQVMMTRRDESLKPAPLFPPTTIDEVFGSLKYNGPPISIEEMRVAVIEEAARQDARSRY